MLAVEEDCRFANNIGPLERIGSPLQAPEELPFKLPKPGIQ
jgi:hypothetical protein